MGIHLALLLHQTSVGSCRKSHQNGPFHVVYEEMDSVSLWEGKRLLDLVPSPRLTPGKTSLTDCGFFSRWFSEIQAFMGIFSQVDSSRSYLSYHTGDPCLLPEKLTTEPLISAIFQYEKESILKSTLVLNAIS